MKRTHLCARQAHAAVAARDHDGAPARILLVADATGARVAKRQVLSGMEGVRDPRVSARHSRKVVRLPLLVPCSPLRLGGHPLALQSLLSILNRSVCVTRMRICRSILLETVQRQRQDQRRARSLRQPPVPVDVEDCDLYDPGKSAFCDVENGEIVILELGSGSRMISFFLL